MKVFILEDDEQRITSFIRAGIGHDLTVARDCEQAKKTFQPPYDLLLLDHDLGGRVYVNSTDENTGAAFCRWADFSDGKDIIVHSYNRDGAMNMIRTIREREPGARAIWTPFGPSVLAVLESSQSDDAVARPDGTSAD